MRNDEADPAYETLEIGTPRDYTGDVYKVYLEVVEQDDIVLHTLTEFLGKDKASRINKLAHGYELKLPIQCIPDVIKLLSQKNIGVYQVIRYAKTNSTWA